ncbi:MAG TPA: hypothetical protein VGI92_12415 [Gemmatimonadales bacterium]
MIHTRSYTVVFQSPFTLPGLDRSYPAGSYAIHADDEQLDLSFAATRRVATTILLTSGATTQAWPVQPTDLDAALQRDAAPRSK